MTIAQINRIVSTITSQYLTQCPRFITKDLMDEVNSDHTLSDESAFCALFSACTGVAENPEAWCRDIEHLWLPAMFSKLNPENYRNNPYYRDITIPEASSGKYRLLHEIYMPFEAFVWKSTIVDHVGRNIPQIGFFTEEFRFPALCHDEIEWMAVKPNEIETMSQHIHGAHGRVVTFGLGLGYFPYLASLKDDVTEITIVEIDETIIHLFEKYILPQFKTRDKIRIVHDDAFHYLKTSMPHEQYDTAFADIWHDEADGAPLYRQFKSLERNFPETVFHYWIEDLIQRYIHGEKE